MIDVPGARVALVTSRYTPSEDGVGGGARHLAEALVAAGHEVCVLTQGMAGGRPVDEVIGGVAVRRFTPSASGGTHLLAPGLARHLAGGRDAYDLVHVHGCEVPAEAVSMWWDGPLVFSPHLHGGRVASLRAALDRAQGSVGHHVMARASAVLCDSTLEQRVITERFPEVAGKAMVLPAGIDVRRLREARLDLGDRRRLLLVAGALEPVRRVDLVIAAMSLLGPGYRLELHGDGSARADLEWQVQRLGLAGSVSFHPSASEAAVASALSSAACVVDVADGTDGAVGVLRAAAVGTPAVAFATPAHVEARDRAGEVISLVPEAAGVRQVTDAIRAAAGGRWFPIDLPEWADVGARVGEVYRRAQADRVLAAV